MSTVNGDEIEVNYGDRIVSLPERLDIIERNVRRLAMLVLAMVVALFLHAILPPGVLLQLLVDLVNLL